MIRFGRFVATTLVLCTIGCRALPNIPEDVCGNGVIEAPEDCDGFPRGGIECRPPGDAAECRLDCSPRANGERGVCPPRWGCDAEFTCRPPSGGFREVLPAIPGNAWSLALGDFDGDRRDDVLSQEPAGLLGFTKIRVHYLNEELARTKTWASEKTLATPTITRFPANATRSGLVFSDFRVNVWLGEEDGSLIPGIYSTYYLPNVRTRAFSLRRGLVSGVTALLLLTESGKSFGMFRPEPALERLIKIADLPGDLDDLTSEPAIGDLFEDEERYPCGDVALAHRGAVEVQVYSVCERSAAGTVEWRRTPEIRAVPTEPPTPLDGGVLIADMNGDGHQDLLIGVDGMLSVAYGDGTRLAPARIVSAAIGVEPARPLSMPLAAGDVTSDGLADLVYPQMILIAQPPTGRDPQFASVHGRFRAPWTAARIADFNGNGLPDIVAASEFGVDIDFFNGTGKNVLNPFTIPTTHPVRHLSVGDVDGDLLNDVVFTQMSSFGEEDELAVAFGMLAGPPNDPTPVAHVDGVQQIATFADDEEDSAADVVLLYEQEDRAGSMGSALAVLDGAGDRSLPCAVELTTFAANDSLVSVPSAAVTVGSFVRAGETDALALALTCEPISELCDFSQRTPELWLLPNLARRTSAPERLGWAFDARLGLVQGSDVRVAFTAGELDGDGLDDVVVVAPDATTRERCVVSTASLAAGGEDRVRPRSSVLLPDPCTDRPQVRIDDLDGDGAKDIVLLTADLAGAARLQVLWNEGGDFDVARSTVIGAPSQVPRAFTTFRPSGSEPVRLAVLSASRLRFFDAQGSARTFTEARFDPDVQFQFPTGVGAGDLDGDGVQDLAVAEAGTIRLFHAELEQR